MVIDSMPALHFTLVKTTFHITASVVAIWAALAKLWVLLLFIYTKFPVISHCNAKLQTFLWDGDYCSLVHMCLPGSSPKFLHLTLTVIVQKNFFAMICDWNMWHYAVPPWKPSTGPHPVLRRGLLHYSNMYTFCDLRFADSICCSQGSWITLWS